MTGHRERRGCGPTLGGRGPRIAPGHAQLRHLVERGAPEEDLRGGAVVRPRADLAAEDRFEPAHGRLGEAAAVVAHLVFPPRPADAADAPQMLVPLERRRVTVAVLANAWASSTAGPRGKHGARALGPRRDRVVTLPFVVGAVGADLRQRRGLQREQP